MQGQHTILGVAEELSEHQDGSIATTDHGMARCQQDVGVGEHGRPLVNGAYAARLTGGGDHHAP